MSIMPIIRQLVSAYPNAQVTVETIAVYDRLLSDIPPGDLQTVVDQCVAECKFMPTVAELRERYHALTRTIGRMSAGEAWGKVKAEIRRIGSWGTPTFDDPIIARVVRNMGWMELCTSESPEGVDRAQFERAYNDLIARDEQVHKLLPQARELAEERTGRQLQHISAFLPGPKRAESN
jgi:hypothetical protein